jgi:hypothetical protein
MDLGLQRALILPGRVAAVSECWKGAWGSPLASLRGSGRQELQETQTFPAPKHAQK